MSRNLTLRRTVASASLQILASVLSGAILACTTDLSVDKRPCGVLWCLQGHHTRKQRPPRQMATSDLSRIKVRKSSGSTVLVVCCVFVWKIHHRSGTASELDDWDMTGATPWSP